MDEAQCPRPTRNTECDDHLLLEQFTMAPSNAAVMNSPRDLLRIPQELRDKILGFVIPALETSMLPEEEDENNREFLDDVKLLGWNGDDRVRYQKLARPGNIQTLFINHQLRSETLALIEHLRLPSPRSYRLDIAIVDETDLWATWLYAPVLSRNVDEVVATLRICGTTTRTRCGFSEGCGGPPLIIWSFFNLLERFLKVGPVGRQAEDKDRVIAIQSLVIDIKTPDVPEELLAPMEVEDSSYFSHRDLMHLRKETGIDYVLNPRKLVSFLTDYPGIDAALGMSNTTAKYGGIFYERIGKIKVTLDGVLVKEYDLAERYVRLSRCSPGLEWECLGDQVTPEKHLLMVF